MEKLIYFRFIVSREIKDKPTYGYSMFRIKHIYYSTDFHCTVLKTNDNIIYIPSTQNEHDSLMEVLFCSESIWTDLCGFSPYLKEDYPDIEEWKLEDINIKRLENIRKLNNNIKANIKGV